MKDYGLQSFRILDFLAKCVIQLKNDIYSDSIWEKSTFVVSSIPSRADGGEQVYERTKKGLVRLKKTLKDNAEEDLVAAFKGGVACVNGHRKKMGYTFDHDDVHKRAT